MVSPYTPTKALALVTPSTDRALAWFREWTGGELVGFGEGFAVELRNIQDLCHGMLDAGFTVEKEGMSMVRSAEGDLVLEKP